MRIIRDEGPMGSLLMITLFVDWHIRRCNVSGCTSRPTTIITGIDEAGGSFGLCEEHHNEAKAKGELDFTLDFDDFDAFEAERKGGDPTLADGSRDDPGNSDGLSE